MKKELPIRKRNRLDGYPYDSCGMYFITLCTLDRKSLFWENVGAITDRPQEITLSRYGKIVEEALMQIPQVYPAVFVESYTVMPNHIHLLLSVGLDEGGRPVVAPTISRIVQQLKGIVVKRIGRPIWQKSFYDHIIRDQRDYEEHLRYIEENPLKWELDELYKK